jgi:hypothetical protein
MILDTLLLFSNEQAITADAASTNVIDLGADRDLGVADIDLICQVSTTLDSTGEAATLTVSLQTDSDEAFGSPTTLFATAAIAEATLVQGYYIIKMKLPQVTERYLRLYYDRGTEDFTSGKVTAGLLTGKQNWRAYDAVTGV